MIRRLVCVLMLSVLPGGAFAAVTARMATPNPIPAEQIAVYNKIRAKLSPLTLAKLQTLEPRINASLKSNPSADPQQDASTIIMNSGVLPPGPDIAEVCFVVLMDATNDQDRDLRTILAGSGAETSAKTKVRSETSVAKTTASNASSRQIIASNSVQAMATIVPKPAATQPTQSRNDLDAASDISQTRSMRIQTVIESRNKLIETLSNMMKKIDDTQNGIVHTIK